VLVLVIATVAVGCGGGQDKQLRPKADFIAVGDVICKNHQSRREDLESQTIGLGRLASEGKAHQVAELLRLQSDNLTAEAKELAALQPPPADADAVGSILSLDRAKARLIDDWAKAYDDLDTVKMRSLQIRIGVATARARDRARAYGFDVCGRD
jgi:hypothetical protein